MSFIRWDDTFSIGVEEIDNQHKTLLSIINDLADSIAEGKNSEVLAEIIGRLFDYTLEHFHTEERIFSLSSFPEADAHKLEHAGFIEKVAQFKDDFLNERADPSLEMITYLCDWLKNHIKKNDMRLGPYLRENRFSN